MGYQISYQFCGLMLIIVLVAGGAIYLIQSGLRWTRPIKWRIGLGAALLVALVLLMVASGGAWGAYYLYICVAPVAIAGALWLLFPSTEEKTSNDSARAASAQDILKARYADGEITTEEYQEILHTIQQESTR